MTSARQWFWRTVVVLLAVGPVAWTSINDWQLLAGSVGGAPAAHESGVCPQGQNVPILPSPHISWQEAGDVSYNSVPPTSGPHFSFALATGVYTDPVPDGLTVHALEHGHVVIQYAQDTPKQTVALLEKLAKRHMDKVVLAPYAKLDHGIALTAWGCLLFLEMPDDRAEDFVLSLAGRYEHGWRADR